MMEGIPPIYYAVEQDPETGAYTAFCPSMKPVRFSSMDRAEAVALLRDGIQLYLERHPDFFKSFEKLEVQ